MLQGWALLGTIQYAAALCCAGSCHSAQAELGPGLSPKQEACGEAGRRQLRSVEERLGEGWLGVRGQLPQTGQCQEAVWESGTKAML